MFVLVCVVSGKKSSVNSRNSLALPSAPLKFVGKPLVMKILTQRHKGTKKIWDNFSKSSRIGKISCIKTSIFALFFFLCVFVPWCETFFYKLLRSLREENRVMPLTEYHGDTGDTEERLSNQHLTKEAKDAIINML